MALGKILVSALLLAILGTIGVVLASAPLHTLYTPEQCLEAYATARSSTDTTHIDLRRYLPHSGTTANRRCGEVRAVVAGRASDITSR